MHTAPSVRTATSFKRFWRRNSGYLFILPTLLFLFAVVAYPLFYNIAMSFRQVDAGTLNAAQPFIGLENYKNVWNNKLFFSSLKNTIVFSVACIFFQFTIGFCLALLFSKAFPGNRFLRGILLTCWMIPTMVAGALWKWDFAGDTSGILNHILMLLGLVQEPVPWITSPDYALASLIISNVWRGIPFNMLLLATALTTLPQDIYEAAAIDGASAIQRFFRITIPMIRPNIISVITLGFVYTFKAFELIYTMTKGGPINSTHNLATFSYIQTFEYFKFGEGAAIANILLVLLMVVGAVNLRVSGKDEVMS